MKKLCLLLMFLPSMVGAYDLRDVKYIFWNSYTNKPDAYLDKVSSATYATYAQTSGSGGGGGTVITTGGLWQLQDGRLSPYPQGLTDTLWELTNGILRLK